MIDLIRPMLRMLFGIGIVVAVVAAAENTGPLLYFVGGAMIGLGTMGWSDD